MTATALSEVDFIDLYLGEDYAELKGLVGTSRFLVPVPDSLTSDVDQLRALCVRRQKETGRNEFSCFYGGRLYRATVSQDLLGRTDLVLRQTPASIPAFEDIPLSTPLRKSIELPGATGLDQARPQPPLQYCGTASRSQAAWAFLLRIRQRLFCRADTATGAASSWKLWKARATPAPHANLIAWVLQRSCWVKFATAPRHTKCLKPH